MHMLSYLKTAMQMKRQQHYFSHKRKTLLPWLGFKPTTADQLSG